MEDTNKKNNWLINHKKYFFILIVLIIVVFLTLKYSTPHFALSPNETSVKTYLFPVDSSVKDLFISIQASGKTSEKVAGYKTDPSYELLAKHTGGEIMAWTPEEYLKIPSELIGIVANSNSGDAQSILLADHEGGGQKLEAHILQPSGRDVSLENNNPDIQFFNYSGGIIAKISRPQLGNWKIEVPEKSTISIRVSAQSDISVLGFSVMELRPSRESGTGYFSTDREPKKGSKEQLGITLYGNNSKDRPEFVLVSVDAGDLVKVNLENNYQNTEVIDLMGQVAIPKAPFRVMVRGQNKDGGFYQRMISRIY